MAKSKSQSTKNFTSILNRMTFGEVPSIVGDMVSHCNTRIRTSFKQSQNYLCHQRAQASDLEGLSAEILGVTPETLRKIATFHHS